MPAYIKTYINKNPYQDTDAVCGIIADVLSEIGFSTTEYPRSAKLALSVGGDGTLIDTVRLCPQADIIGINKGTLGFLSVVGEDKVAESLRAYGKRQYYIETRMMAECEVAIPGEESELMKHPALNDIVMSKSGSSIITASIYIDGCHVVTYRADGIIVSTPTGATGYAFSCGAPIIDPTSEMIVITPVAPHSIMDRSICISPKSSVKICLLEARGCDSCTLSIDGDKTEIPIGTKLNIFKSPQFARFVKFKKQESFFDRIIDKIR